MPPRLIVTSDTVDFDEEILTNFQEEGFQVWYLPYGGDKTEYDNQIQHLADSLEPGEKYAIVAYGDAASVCLEACQKPMPKLCALVAYYPSSMPGAAVDFPSPVKIQTHLASSQTFGTRHPSYRYPDTQPGFAESDLEEHDAISSSIAWSRNLDALRRGFGITVDLETIWDNHYMRFRPKHHNADVAARTQTAVPPSSTITTINHVPVMTGGEGHDDVLRFHRDFFTPGTPPSMRTRLLSRTVGTDQVVDEIFVSFTHDTPVPWMLPGVPPTDRHVEVVVVTVVRIRGGRVHHEHVYWDQASVLVQIGLLDPNLVPDPGTGTFRTVERGREKEVKRLPVLGAEAARKLIGDHAGPFNRLIPDW